MGSPETLRTKNGLSKQKSSGHCLSHSQFGSRPMYHVGAMSSLRLSERLSSAPNMS